MNYPFAGSLAAAALHLKTHDPQLAAVITAHGPCELMPHTDYYGALLQAIISQQLSTHAAKAIAARLRALCEGHNPSPETLLAIPEATLREIGLSRNKVAYMRDLGARIIAGTLNLTTLSTLPSETIIDELTAVKGIGEWTAHMFLIFSVGRLDILPVGDLGIRKGIQRLYRLEILPTPEIIRQVASQYQWHPYESVASWYIWRSLDDQAAAKT